MKWPAVSFMCGWKKYRYLKTHKKTTNKRPTFYLHWKLSEKEITKKKKPNLMRKEKKKKKDSDGSLSHTQAFSL